MESKRSRKRRSDLNGAHVDSHLYAEHGLKILAHLERTLLYSLPLEFFESDVISYYREELGKAISMSEIENKLMLFWSHWRPVGKTQAHWREIYHLGLKGLPGLEQDKAEWVRKKAVELQIKDGTPRRLRSASAFPQALRRTPKRPSDCLVGDPASSRTQRSRQYDESPKRKRTRTRPASVYARSTPLKRSASPFFPVTRQPGVALEFRRGQEGASSVDVSFQTPIFPLSERASPTSNLREWSQQHRDNVADMENELVASNQLSPSGTPLTNAERRHLSEMMSELDDVRSQNAQLRLELDDARSEKGQLMLQLDGLKLQTIDDTRHWKRLYHKTRKRRDSLKRRNKHIQAELTGSTTGETSKTNLTLRHENDLLQEKLDSYQTTSIFKEPFNENFRAQNVEKVIEHVESVQSKLFKILQGQDISFAIERLDGVSGTDLATLFKRALGLDASIDVSAGNFILTVELCTATLQVVVLSLVSAAICIWVLEAEVGALFQENDLFYSKFLSLLATQDRKLADSLQYAALEKCVDDPSVCDLAIPRRARHLARRTLHCIKPLLDAHRNLTEQYVDVADGWVEEERQMTEIFKQALYAKVRLLLTTDLYKCVLPLPGTSFNGVTMERREGPTESEPDAVVSIAIFPVLLQYASEEGFNFSRFLTGEKTPKDIRAKVLREAVVLTR